MSIQFKEIPGSLHGTPSSLSISIVTYSTDLSILAKTIESLAKAVGRARDIGILDEAVLVIIDNGPDTGLDAFLMNEVHGLWNYGLRYARPLANVGFGAGHNKALRLVSATYHLILNPDVVLEEDAIANALSYLSDHPRVGCITPHACWPGGSRQYLCKDYPSVFTLFLRGFAPRPLAGLFAERLAGYELRGITEGDPTQDIFIASGCFMFCRRRALDEIGGFSGRFFLYFEDFDLCLRLIKTWRIAYVPYVKIVHFGGRSSLKGLRHICMFIRSAAIFFRTHGWNFF